jgi:hypothetical protein
MKRRISRPGKSQETSFTRALATPFPLQAKSGDMLETGKLDERPFRICCGHAPTSSHAAMLSTLTRKLLACRASDRAAEDTTSLDGSRLHPEAGAGSWVGDVDESEEDPVTRSVVTWYRLVAYSARYPVGYCTFRTHIARGTSYHTGPAFEVEVEEVWLEPGWRGAGLAGRLAYWVADIASGVLLELDLRLRGDGATVAEPLSLPVDVVADVYSESGERFLFKTAACLRDSIRELPELYADALLCVVPGEVEPNRPRNLRPSGRSQAAIVNSAACL